MSEALDRFFTDLHQPKTDEQRTFFAAMMKSAREGHLCLDLDQASPEIRAGYTQSPYLRRQGNLVYFEKNFVCEEQIRTDLKRLLLPTVPPPFSSDKLTEEQKTAVNLALSHTLTIIEGGPGTGKTYLTSCLTSVVGGDVILAAPTGKAAARLKMFNPTATCGTLHSLLHYSPRRERSFLKANLIVIDESSMIDARLLAFFLKSLPTGQRVVFLGDVNQLPPIESGNLFADLCQILPTAHLKQCLRSDRIEIAELAHQILEGKMVEPHSPLNHTFLDETEAMILTPLREGEWGVDRLNERIATKMEKKNRHQEKWQIPIMITKTDYEQNLYNGEMGCIWKNAEGFLYAEFGERQFSVSSLPPFELGYVLSIHKSQGSEFDHVIVLVPPGTERFGREILYTAVTRARHSVTICGDVKTIQETVSRTNQRNSGLKCIEF